MLDMSIIGLTDDLLCDNVALTSVKFTV